MASIKVFDLRPAGSELLIDSESFLSELSDVELSETMGGATFTLTTTTVTTKSSPVCWKVIASSGRCGKGAIKVIETGVKFFTQLF